MQCGGINRALPSLPVGFPCSAHPIPETDLARSCLRWGIAQKLRPHGWVFASVAVEAPKDTRQRPTSSPGQQSAGAVQDLTGSCFWRRIEALYDPARARLPRALQLFGL